MPELGEIKRLKKWGNLCIWSACLDCAKERWVPLVGGRNGMPRRNLCNSCNGKKSARLENERRHSLGLHSPTWRGGRNYRNGYVVILAHNHPNATKAGYMFEHRLVMEQILGRYLLPSEKVHHKNGVKDDNRPENLKLISPANHVLYNQLCAHCELRKEIRLLKWQVGELTKQLQGKLISGE